MADAHDSGSVCEGQHRTCAVCSSVFTPLQFWRGRFNARWSKNVGKTCSKACRLVWHARKHTIHGQTNTRLFRIWSNMRRRCGDDRNRAFARYGGRGIAVCPGWREFSAFAAWAEEAGYREDLTLERMDNDAGYSPQNCCWITNVDQQRNRRNVKLRREDIPAIREGLRSGGTLSALSDKFGVSRAMIARIRDGKNWVGV